MVLFCSVPSFPIFTPLKTFTMKNPILFRTLGLVLLACCSTPATAQLKSSDFEGSVIEHNEFLPLADGNMAMISSDKDGIYISTYNSASKLIWEKDVEVTPDIRRTDQFVVSRDGKDIYTVSTHGEIAHVRTEEQYEVSWTDAVTGKNVVKEFPDKDGSFGHVYSTWANSNYLFVMTTRKLMSEDGFSSEGIKVFRFNRESLEKTELRHDMITTQAGLGHIWEVIRVEEEYMEAYAITLAAPEVKIRLGRFDNNGKQVSMKDAAFKIAANHDFVSTKNRPTTSTGVGPVSHGYFERKTQSGVMPFYTSSLSKLQMAYCQSTGTYYACGLTHLDEGKAFGAYRNDGFVIMRFNSDFQVDKTGEYFDKPVFADDNNFTGEDDYMRRHIQCVFDAAGNPVVIMGCKRTYMFSLDKTDLSSTKMEKLENDEFSVAGGVMNAGPNWILKETDAIEMMSSSNKLYVILVSGRTQYAVVQESGGDITVMTKDVK